jgi:SAM-dependent methyltransferase
MLLEGPVPSPPIRSSLVDPPAWDVTVTRLLGRTLLSPVWGGWVERIGLRGAESVLDFGSGSGQLSRRLALAVGPAGRLTCVDRSLRWLEVARKEMVDLAWVDFHLGSPGELPPAAYDLVHLHYVLHDVPPGQRGQVAEELAGRLRAGGRLALREPLYYGPLDLGEVRELFDRVGLRLSEGPTRRRWLAGTVVEVVFQLRR